MRTREKIRLAQKKATQDTLAGERSVRAFAKDLQGLLVKHGIRAITANPNRTGGTEVMVTPKRGSEYVRYSLQAGTVKDLDTRRQRGYAEVTATPTPFTLTA